ncbi:MAG: sigma factor SigF [Synechococcus sp.]|nr:sigma factor SigF [Synechococcus sp.]
MFPPFPCCPSEEEGRASRRRYQERKLRMLTFWRDGIERQLAAVTAAIETLEGQMRRDQASEVQD